MVRRGSSRRRHTLIASRPLVGLGTTQGTIFHNPTTHIRVGDRASKLVHPLEPDQIRRTVAAASRPADWLIRALAAAHAARCGAIRAMLLDDVDLGDWRVTVAGRPRSVDECPASPR